jgi:hypothetical protein
VDDALVGLLRRAARDADPAQPLRTNGTFRQTY